MYDCFISYASEDLAHAEALHERLIAAGFNVWFDKARLQPGCDWYIEIEEACTSSRVALPVLTPHWKLSEWTLRETYAAEKIIPLLAEGKWEDVSTEPLARYQSFCVPIGNHDQTDWQLLFNSIRQTCSRPRDAGVIHKPNNLPFAPLGSLFKGREETLSRIHAVFEKRECSAVALYGLGGIGKTRVALEYAHLHHDDYAAFIYVHADSEVNLRTNLAALYVDSVLEIPDVPAADTKAQSRAVLRWLETHFGWLLIFDNVDTEEAAVAVENLLGRLSANGRVLITSRLASWSNAVKDLQLDVLRLEDAAEYLLESTESKRYSTDTDPSDAAKLATLLGQLPLALTQASAYIRELGLSFQGYLQKWSEAHSKVIHWFDGRQMMYTKSVAATWQTSFEQLSIDAQQLLQILSWFAPNPIPLSLLATPIPESESATGRSAHTLEEAAAQLNRYSLATRNSSAASFRIHLLVQDVTRGSMSDEEKTMSLEYALDWLNTAMTGDPQDVRNWHVLEPLAPHSEAIALNPVTERHSRSLASRLLNYCAILHDGRARFAAAEPLMRRALQLDETDPQLDQIDLARDLNDLGFLLLDMNRFIEAELSLQRALTINQSIPANAAKLVENLSNLAIALENLGRLNEAEATYLRALGLCESDDYPDQQRMARVLNNLAGILMNTNRLSEAEEMYGRAIIIGKGSFGPNHPEVATFLSNLARLLAATNRLAEAEPMFRSALAIREATYANNHPNIAYSLNSLAGVVEAMDRPAEAAPLYRRALAIWTEIGNSTGFKDPEIDDSLMSYVEVLVELNRSRDDIDECLSQLPHELVAADVNRIIDLANVNIRIKALEAYKSGRINTARRLLASLILGKYQLASTNCHLARLDLLQDEIESVRNHVAEAWENRADAEPHVIPRIHWLNLACAYIAAESFDDPNKILADLHASLDQAGAIVEWTMQPVLEHIKPKVTEAQYKLLAEFVDKMSGTELTG